MTNTWNRLRDRFFPSLDRRRQKTSWRAHAGVAAFAHHLEETQKSAPEVAKYMIENSEAIEADLDDRMTLEAWRKMHQVAWLLRDARQTESLDRVARVEEMARDCAEQRLGRHARPILEALDL